jgi:hypothetical protein
MPKHISEREFESILAIVGSFPHSCSLEEIEQALKDSSPSLTLSRRTLQRRLASLVKDKRLHIEGTTRGARYRVTGSPGQEQVEALAGSSSGDLTVSGEAQSIRRAVRALPHLREPVGYNHEFLEKYRPNQSEYLSAALRQHLAAAGHTPGGDLPAGTYARQILNRLLIDLAWNSSRLEGNTYSLLETERLLERGENAEGKAAQDTQMILNHKAAIEMLVTDAAQIGFNRYTILNLHGLLADNLLPDPGAGGRLRNIAVSISGTVFYPLEVPQLINEYFNEILVKATAIADPFEQAFFVMVHLSYLQPFEDVNKRVSRLAANIPLIRRNLCPLSFVDVPQRDYIDGILGIYELNRIELLRDVFVWAYERSCRRYAVVRGSMGEPDPFRLRHRTFLLAIVEEILKEAMDTKAAGAFIRKKAAALPAADKDRFIEMVETELQNLHEGNFARYRVRPSEFEAWQKSWQ